MLKYWNGGLCVLYAIGIHVRLQLCNHVIDCSVQCTIGTRNSKTTVHRDEYMTALKSGHLSNEDTVCCPAV